MTMTAHEWALLFSATPAAYVDGVIAGLDEALNAAKDRLAYHLEIYPKEPKRYLSWH